MLASAFRASASETSESAYSNGTSVGSTPDTLAPALDVRREAPRRGIRDERRPSCPRRRSTPDWTRAVRRTGVRTPARPGANRTHRWASPAPARGREHVGGGSTGRLDVGGDRHRHVDAGAAQSVQRAAGRLAKLPVGRAGGDRGRARGRRRHRGSHQARPRARWRRLASAAPGHRTLPGYRPLGTGSADRAGVRAPPRSERSRRGLSRSSACSSSDGRRRPSGRSRHERYPC